jgi:hypothetical protein
VPLQGINKNIPPDENMVTFKAKMNVANSKPNERFTSWYNLSLGMLRPNQRYKNDTKEYSADDGEVRLQE